MDEGGLLGEDYVSNKGKIEVVGFDSRGPVTKDNVASVVIRDPDLPKSSENVYCIGFKLTGSKKDMTRSKSWIYDHTYYYDYDDPGYSDEEEPKKVSRTELDSILSRYGISLELLLEQYCDLLGRSLSRPKTGK